MCAIGISFSIDTDIFRRVSACLCKLYFHLWRFTHLWIYHSVQVMQYQKIELLVGSLTEQRAKKASQHINNEMLTLVSVIRGIGEQDETNPNIVRVTFGRLFHYYTSISNKVRIL